MWLPFEANLHKAFMPGAMDETANFVCKSWASICPFVVSLTSIFNSSIFSVPPSLESLRAFATSGPACVYFYQNSDDVDNTRHSRARVRATFIRFGLSRKPTRSAFRRLMNTTSASCPWKRSVVLTTMLTGEGFFISSRLNLMNWSSPVRSCTMLTNAFRCF